MNRTSTAGVTVTATEPSTQMQPITDHEEKKDYEDSTMDVTRSSSSEPASPASSSESESESASDNESTMVDTDADATLNPMQQLAASAAMNHSPVQSSPTSSIGPSSRAVEPVIDQKEDDDSSSSEEEDEGEYINRFREMARQPKYGQLDLSSLELRSILPIRTDFAMVHHWDGVYDRYGQRQRYQFMMALNIQRLKLELEHHLRLNATQNEATNWAIN